MASESQPSPSRRRNSHQSIACTRCRGKKKKCLYDKNGPSGPCVACRVRGLADNCLFVPDRRSRNTRPPDASDASAFGPAAHTPTDLGDRTVHHLGAIPTAAMTTFSTSSLLTLLNCALAQINALRHQTMSRSPSSNSSNDHQLDADLASAFQGAYRAISLLRATLQRPALQIEGFPPESRDSKVPSGLARDAGIAPGMFEETPPSPRWEQEQKTFSNGLALTGVHYIREGAIASRSYPVGDGGPVHQSGFLASFPSRIGGTTSRSYTVSPSVSEENYFGQPSQPQPFSYGCNLDSIPHVSIMDQLQGIGAEVESVQYLVCPTTYQRLDATGAELPWAL